MSKSFGDDFRHHMGVCRDLALNRGDAVRKISTDASSVWRSILVLAFSLLLLVGIDILTFDNKIADGTLPADAMLAPHLILGLLTAVAGTALGYGFVWGVSGPGGFEHNFLRYFAISNWIQLPLAVFSIAIFFVLARLGDPENAALQSLLVLLLLFYLVVVITIALRVMRHALEIPWLWTAAMMIVLVVLDLGVSNLTGA